MGEPGGWVGPFPPRPSGNQALPSSKSPIILTVFVLASSFIAAITHSRANPATRHIAAYGCSEALCPEPGGRVLFPRQGERCVHSTPVTRLPRESTEYTAPQRPDSPGENCVHSTPVT